MDGQTYSASTLYRRRKKRRKVHRDMCTGCEDCEYHAHTPPKTFDQQVTTSHADTDESDCFAESGHGSCHEEKDDSDNLDCVSAADTVLLPGEEHQPQHLHPEELNESSDVEDVPVRLLSASPPSSVSVMNARSRDASLSSLSPEQHAASNISLHSTSFESECCHVQLSDHEEELNSSSTEGTECNFDTRRLYLEHEDEQNNYENDNFNGDNPGPDSPHGSSDSELSSDEDPEDGHEGNFSWNNPHLDIICRNFGNRSLREVLALQLAVAVKNNLTYEALLDNMSSFNTSVGRKYLPTNKFALWRLLQRNSLGIKKFAYCPSCHYYFGPWEELHDAVFCPSCTVDIPKRKVSYFVSLSLKRRLSRLLHNNSIARALNDPNRREGRNEAEMRDILDGMKYRELQQPPGPLSSIYQYSYEINTDAFELASSSRLKAVPIFIRLNELPMEMRQKHILLAAVWVDQREPCMTTYLKPFVAQANRLSRAGVTWTPQGNNEPVRSKFIPTVGVFDAKARAPVMNFTAPTGYNACNFCDHVGINPGNGVKYPILPPIPIPDSRTHDGIMTAMRIAFHTDERYQGFIGPSAFMTLRYFNLAHGLTTDDLHPVFLGVVCFHLTLLLTTAGAEYYIGDPQSLAVINNRLKDIKTPTHISRKPRPIETMRKWKGTEWRNFLLYYLVPCLRGVLRQRYLSHFLELAEAVFLLSRDGIRNEDIDNAEQLIRSYLIKFQRYFGIEKMRYNVHVLQHIPDCVRRWGPVYAHSTFGFEDWNHTLLKTVTSPKGAIDQITNRYLLEIFLAEVDDDENFAEDIKEKIREILGKGSRYRNADIVDNVFLVGKGEERAPTEEETGLLNDEGHACNLVTSYSRALVRGMEYRTEAYRYAGEETRSDNSYILTADNAFGRIKSIIKFRDNNGVERAMVIIHVLNTGDAVPPTSYIIPVNEGAEVSMMISFNQISTHAVLCSIPHGSFVMPVTNPFEID